MQSHERGRTGFPKLESMAMATHETSSTSTRSRRRMVLAEAITLVVKAATIAARTGVCL
jgi:hypothetical protein